MRIGSEEMSIKHTDYTKKKKKILMLMLHAIPSVIKFFVSDLGVSCLFLASMKR